MIKDILCIVITVVVLIWDFFLSVETIKTLKKNEGSFKFKVIATLGIVLAMIQLLEPLDYALKNEWYNMEFGMIMPTVFIILSYVISKIGQ